MRDILVRILDFSSLQLAVVQLPFTFFYRGMIDSVKPLLLKTGMFGNFFSPVFISLLRYSLTVFLIK